jgi:hypothetical protein
MFHWAMHWGHSGPLKQQNCMSRVQGKLPEPVQNIKSSFKVVTMILPDKLCDVSLVDSQDTVNSTAYSTHACTEGVP